MMMSHDSTSGPRTLSPASVARLQAALGAYVDTPASGDALGDALHLVAEDARLQGMSPEHLLIALKEVWYTVPAVVAAREPEVQVRLLQGVVTLCIKAYFR